MVYRTALTGPIFGLRREIDRLFEDTFGRESARAGWAPAVDVREDSKAIVLEVELAGVRPEDVEVTAENGVLTIRGEKQSSHTSGGDDEGRYHVIERTYGTFTRSFQLPNGLDEDRIDAEFSDGLLTVRIPKAELAQPRRINVRNSGSQQAIQGTPSKSGTKPSTRGEQTVQASSASRTSTSSAGRGDASGERSASESESEGSRTGQSRSGR